MEQDMSEQDRPKDAEDILSEFDSRTKSSAETRDEPSGVEISTSDSLNQSTQSTLTDEYTSPSTEGSESTSMNESESADPAQSPEPSTDTKDSQSTEPTLEQNTADEDRNVVFVGSKPIMVYVSATLTQLSTRPTVIIKARGKRITQAVDVSQMILKRMNTVGYVISDVRISSMQVTSQDGKNRNVSTIEIDISKS